MADELKDDVLVEDDEFDIVEDGEAEEGSVGEAVEGAVDEDTAGPEAAGAADEDTDEDVAEPETAGPAAEVDEDPEVADLIAQGFKPKIVSRVKREIKLRRQAEAATEQAIAAARARTEEAQRLQAQLAMLRKGYAEVLESALVDRIANRTEQLRKARDDQDFDAETKVQAELDDLRYKLNQVRDTAARLGDGASAESGAQPDKPATAPLPVRNPFAEQWLERNRAWFNNPKHKMYRRAALLIDQELDEEGYNKQSAEYFRELDRRFNEQFPTFRKKPTAAPAVRQPVAAVSSSASVGKPAANKVVITRADKEVMLKFGLDPTNKEHLREFARQKRAVA